MGILGFKTIAHMFPRCKCDRAHLVLRQLRGTSYPLWPSSSWQRVHQAHSVVTWLLTAKKKKQLQDLFMKVLSEVLPEVFDFLWRLDVFVLEQAANQLVTERMAREGQQKKKGSRTRPWLSLLLV